MNIIHVEKIADATELIFISLKSQLGFLQIQTFALFASLK